jgi:antitoxin VapB
MATAKVFKSGNSQAVRLPKEFRLAGPEVEIFRRGDEIVMRETSGSPYLRALEILSQLPDDFEIPDDPPPKDRDFDL